MRRMTEVLNLKPYFTHSHEKNVQNCPHVLIKEGDLYVCCPAVWLDWYGSPKLSDTSLQCKARPANRGRPSAMSLFSSPRSTRKNTAKEWGTRPAQMNTQLQKTRPAETTNEDHAPTRKSRLGKMDVSAPEDHTQQDSRECVQLKRKRPNPPTCQRRMPSLFSDLKWKSSSTNLLEITMPIPANEKPEWLLQSHG